MKDWNSNVSFTTITPFEFVLVTAFSHQPSPWTDDNLKSFAALISCKLVNRWKSIKSIHSKLLMLSQESFLKCIFFNEAYVQVTWDPQDPLSSVPWDLRLNLLESCYLVFSYTKCGGATNKESFVASRNPGCNPRSILWSCQKN